MYICVPRSCDRPCAAECATLSPPVSGYRSGVRGCEQEKSNDGCFEIVQQYSTVHRKCKCGAVRCSADAVARFRDVEGNLGEM